MNAWIQKAVKILAYCLYVIIVVVAGLELALRIYDPFGFRQKDNEVILPRNRKMIFNNTRLPGIDKRVVHTKNSLGFRGPEPPSNLNEYTSIIAVGGSATECFYQDDSACWTNLLGQNLGKSINNVWINNAAYQGHSTFGNFILINDYIKHIKPRYVLLMEGVNEINRYDIKDDECVSLDCGKTTVWGWLKRNSHFLNAAMNIERYFMAERLAVTDGYFNHNPVTDYYISPSSIDSALLKQVPLVNEYEKRLNRIIDTCVRNNIHPVLITQPILFGEGKDCITNIDLATIKSTDGYNGKLMWDLLELYNNKTREIAKQKNIFLIDLSKEMPKCSRYFYDICHFTNEGSRLVSEMVGSHLVSFIR